MGPTLSSPLLFPVTWSVSMYDSKCSLWSDILLCVPLTGGPVLLVAICPTAALNDVLHGSISHHS